MSKNNNVNPGQHKVAGRERQGEDGGRDQAESRTSEARRRISSRAARHPTNAPNVSPSFICSRRRSSDQRARPCASPRGGTPCAAARPAEPPGESRRRRRGLGKAPIVVGPILGLEKRVRRRHVGDPFRGGVSRADLLRPVVALDPALACGELAGMILIPSAAHIRPNWVNGSAPVSRSA